MAGVKKALSYEDSAFSVGGRHVGDPFRYLGEFSTEPDGKIHTYPVAGLPRASPYGLTTGNL